MSVPPAAVRFVTGEVGKATDPWKVPATATLPDASTATAWPSSSAAPPIAFNHSTFPLGSSFAANASYPPALETVVVPIVSEP